MNSTREANRPATCISKRCAAKLDPGGLVLAAGARTLSPLNEPKLDRSGAGRTA